MPSLRSRLFCALLLLALPGGAGAGDYRAISWEDLRDPSAATQEPTLQMKRGVRNYLNHYSRLERLEQETPDYFTEGMRTRKQARKAWLEKQGVDIPAALEALERESEARGLAAIRTNPELANTEIEMGGFMLALEWVDGMVSEFLLVPTVGACIHTPPPPSNQVVLVRLREPVPSNAHYEAVRVRGKLSIDTQRSNLFLVDGEGEIGSAYTLEAKEVSSY